MPAPLMTGSTYSSSQSLPSIVARDTSSAVTTREATSLDYTLPAHTEASSSIYAQTPRPPPHDVRGDSQVANKLTASQTVTNQSRYSSQSSNPFTITWPPADLSASSRSPASSSSNGAVATSSVRLSRQVLRQKAVDRSRRHTSGDAT